MARKLVVFDVDGTLTRSNHCDAIAFVAAVEDVLGIKDICQDWSLYQNVTDSGILDELVNNAFGRSPTDHELAAVQDRCKALLEAYLAEEELEPVAGAPELLERLSADLSWDVAFATGAWLGSTVAKFRAAGLSLDLDKGASADDAVRRDEIATTAIRRCAEKAGGIAFDRIVSVGDGVWDVKTAAGLALPFVGIGAETDVGLLRQAGANHVIESFTDVEATLLLFDRALPPRSSKNS
jgi:phosphoglycolate phosphatase-like HAD superfamily hydrolase